MAKPREQLSLPLLLFALCARGITSPPGPNYFGGTIGFTVWSNNTVRFDWNQAWRLGFGPATFVWGDWSCVSGCRGKLSPVQYTVTTTNANVFPYWEIGENRWITSFNGSGPFMIQYTECCWMSFVSNSQLITMQLGFHVGNRSDTKAPNNSPLIGGFNFNSINSICGNVTWTFPMTDPDNDTVTCRWSTTLEAGNSTNELSNCTSLTFAGSECIMVVDARCLGQPYQYYPVAITVEDFPRSSIAMGGITYSTNRSLSNIPFQFTVYTTVPLFSRFAGRCNLRPEIHIPTVSGTSMSAQSGSNISITVYANSTIGSVSDIFVSGQRGIAVSPPTGVHPGTFNGVFITISWSPNVCQTGVKSICFEAYNTMAKSTDFQCIAVNVRATAANGPPSICSAPGFPIGTVRLYPSLTSTFCHGDVITSNCSYGYEYSSGNYSQICQTNNLFDGTALNCTVITCPTMRPHRNATQVGSSFRYLDYISWTCHTGYEKDTGNFTVQCQANRTWNGTALTCKRITCPSMRPHNNATQVGSSFRYLGVVSWTCHTGYERDTGNLNVQCQANRTWNGTALTCKRRSCPTLAPHNNATQVGSSFLYQDYVSWTCNTGYERDTGDFKVVCQANKTWNGTALTCKRRSCPSLSPGNNATQVGSSFRYLDYISWICNTGYERRTGDFNVQCQANRMWNGSLLQCKVVNCGIPQVGKGARKIAGLNYTHRSATEFSCIRGYTYLSGNSNRTCNYTGVWSGSVFTCEETKDNSLALRLGLGLGLSLLVIASIIATLLIKQNLRPTRVRDVQASNATGPPKPTQPRNPFA